VKATTRLTLGIILGAVGGAVVADLILQIEAVRQTIGIYISDFEIAFGRSVGEHLFAVLKILGALAGAAIGGSLAVSIRWFMALGTLLAGIIIGGTVMFFVEVRTVKYVSGTWEQGRADNEAFVYLQCLKAIDRGTTNQFYLLRFQNSGRMVLSNYVSEMEKTGIKEHITFSGTNAVAYPIVKKYLATHTNSPPSGRDF
jgi:hypothetical protein